MSQTALLALDGEGIFMQNMVISPSMQFGKRTSRSDIEHRERRAGHQGQRASRNRDDHL